MSLQAEILKTQPLERRKSFKLLAWFVIGFFTLFLAFFYMCVQTGHEDFALKVFGYIMYGVTTVAGFWAGKKTEQRKKKVEKNDDISEAEIVE